MFSWGGCCFSGNYLLIATSKQWAMHWISMMALNLRAQSYLWHHDASEGLGMACISHREKVGFNIEESY